MPASYRASLSDARDERYLLSVLLQKLRLLLALICLLSPCTLERCQLHNEA